MSKKTTFSKTPFEWDIKTIPTFYRIGDEYIPYPNRDTIINKQTSQPISIMSKQYNPLTNERLLESAQIISENFGIKPELYGTMGVGKKVIILFSKGEGININGFAINNHLAIGNSHDGTTGVFFTEKNIMVRCGNVFYTRMKNINILHDLKMDKILYETEKSIIAFGKDRLKEKERLERYSEIKIAPEILLNAGKAILNVKDNQMTKNAATKLLKLQESMNIEMTDTGFTAFGLFNAVTHYNTHKLSGDGKFYMPTSVRAKNIERLHKYVESLV
jgi:hypothetical protein